jgi:hypothetical protein
MPNIAPTILRSLVLVSAIPALGYSISECASAATQAGMVTLLIPDLLSPDLFFFFIPAYLALLFGAAYLALTNNMGKPNYRHLVGVLLALPVINAVHDELVTMLSGSYLRSYLVFVTCLTAALFLLTLFGRKAKSSTSGENYNAANASVC